MIFLEDMIQLYRSAEVVQTNWDGRRVLYLRCRFQSIVIRHDNSHHSMADGPINARGWLTTIGQQRAAGLTISQLGCQPASILFVIDF